MNTRATEMAQTPELLPVEQSDREAAAAFVHAWDDKYGDGQNDFGPSEVDSIWLRSGDHDGELIIQHFARHRLSHASHEPASVMREEAVEVEPWSDVVRKIVQDVAELPDRTSPDDWPDAMLVTGDELFDIVHSRIEQALAAIRNLPLSDKADTPNAIDT
jgi:hypothetical protein